MRRSLSDESRSLSKLNEVEGTKSLRDIEITNNEAVENKITPKSKTLVYNYSYKYSGSQYPNKVILEKLAIVTKAFKKNFNEEQTNRFIEVCNEL